VVSDTTRASPTVVKMRKGHVRLAIAATALALLAAGCGGRQAVRTVTVTTAATGADQRYFGHIVGIARRGSLYELRFDPAWLTSGVTANAAAAAATGSRCRPQACPPVPNDFYEIDDSHTALVFLLPATAHGTVLLRGAPGGLQPGTTISAPQLAALVHHHSRLHLFEPLASGVWLSVHVDTVRTFAQQYLP